MTEIKKMSEIEIYLEAIHDVYPDFVIEKVHEYNRDGQFNHILIINNEFIFRFPRYVEGIESLITEVRLLKLIRSHISLPIPNPIYSNINPESASKTFMGYGLIPGEPLWHEKLAAITDDVKLQGLANQLGIFLKELHAIPIEKMAENLFVRDGIDEWKKLYAEIRLNLYRFMRLDAQAWVSNYFEAYFNNTRLQTYRASLRHGDFGTGNILYNHETQTISGVIDFSSIGFGDPAIDIAAAFCYGEQFLKRFFPVYPEIEFMLERAQFYKGTYALQEALHGFRNNDQEAFDSGMSEYV
jgi:aminoglycoside 2''-phosphotransferase